VDSIKIGIMRLENVKVSIGAAVGYDEILKGFII
jgi:hypothetical protein